MLRLRRCTMTLRCRGNRRWSGWIFDHTWIGVLAILVGLSHLAAGRTDYSNWWAGLAFAPFTIAGGAMLLWLAILGGPGTEVNGC